MRRPVVVDCSVAASWFLPLEKTPEYELLLNDILSDTIEMIVPDLWWYEIMNVMKSAISRERIQEEDSRSIYLFLKQIPKKVVEIGDSGQYGILKLAIDNNLSVYEATYLFLAISLGSRLITSNKDLLRLKKRYPLISDQL